MAILHREETSDWFKALILAASLGGFIGALELWFFEFSFNRLFAAISAGAVFAVVFVSIMRVTPIDKPSRAVAILYAVPSGLAGGAMYWFVAVPAISIWVVLAAGIVLGSLMVFGEW